MKKNKKRENKIRKWLSKFDECVKYSNKDIMDNDYEEKSKKVKNLLENTWTDKRVYKELRVGCRNNIPKRS
jgi:hypothetical protein